MAFLNTPANPRHLDNRYPMFINGCFLSDVNVKNPEMVQQLRERMQDALLEYETARGQPGHRRMCNLMFLFPMLMHEKILAREFWLSVKKSGRVVLHRLLSEMLDFMCT